jgi:hypothetical protein
MPSILRAECPCCGKIAENDLNKIENLFGFRIMKNGNKIAQSYCRVCRSKRCGQDNQRCK